MYEDKERSIRGIVITILLIILVICVLIWIFPTKIEKKVVVESNNGSSENIVYKNNLYILENAGKAYYYKATIPKNVGDSTKASLKNLIAAKMLNTLKDKNGKACDEKNSYVQLTKKAENKYELKSYLKCSDGDDYILTTLTCEDFKNKCKTSTVSTTKTTTQPTKTTTTTTTTTTTQPTQTYAYRYLFTCKTSNSSYSSWSSWSKNYISSSSTRQVETKVEYERTYQKVGTTQEPIYENKTVYETKEETVRYVDEKPANAKSCQVLPRSTYTIYDCIIETQVPKTVQEITGYRTVDKYDYVSTPVTYYRYRDLYSSASTYQFWTANYSDSNGKNCTLTRTEKVAK